MQSPERFADPVADSHTGPPVSAAAYELVLARMGGDRQLLSEVAQILIDELPQHLDWIRRALDAHDPEALQRAAHGLKGAASNFEAAAVVDRARHFENMGRCGMFVDVAQAWESLRDESARLAAALRQYVSSGDSTSALPAEP